MKLYTELADWWPLVSAPADYAEEAAFYSRLIFEYCTDQPKTVLELGSGGGNNASHLKKQFEMKRSGKMLKPEGMTVRTVN